MSNLPHTKAPTQLTDRNAEDRELDYAILVEVEQTHEIVQVLGVQVSLQ